ncbi:hypothetical protein L9F63_010816, partial [Diploptera punctata]
DRFLKLFPLSSTRTQTIELMESWLMIQAIASETSPVKITEFYEVTLYHRQLFQNVEINIVVPSMSRADNLNFNSLEKLTMVYWTSIRALLILYFGIIMLLLNIRLSVSLASRGICPDNYLINSTLSGKKNIIRTVVSAGASLEVQLPLVQKNFGICPASLDVQMYRVLHRRSGRASALRR